MAKFIRAAHKYGSSLKSLYLFGKIRRFAYEDHSVWRIFRAVEEGTMKFLFSKYIQPLSMFFRDAYHGRRLLLQLVKDDFKRRYVQNYLGILWAFIQPLITILIFWLVFQVGFKSAPVKDIPFILWLVAGILPWFYYTEAIQSSADSVAANSFLVKKIVFKVSLLPLVKLASALVIHVFFLFVMVLLFLLYHFPPSWYWLQVLYYLFASMPLLLGMAWLTSSVSIFFPDLRQMVAVALQFGFWLTPIFWSLSILPQQYQIFFKLNPLYYLVQGYRDSMIEQVWFWQKPWWTLFFWVVTVTVFAVGGMIFRSLKPHFADVL
jgi:ABC-type polysaccharide/polyol phosphate export permease